MHADIQPAILTDVLIEQFDYLLDHQGCAVEGCRDCIRFRIVTAALMEPFTVELRKPDRGAGLMLDEFGCVVTSK